MKLQKIFHLVAVLSVGGFAVVSFAANNQPAPVINLTQANQPATPFSQQLQQNQWQQKMNQRQQGQQGQQQAASGQQSMQNFHMQQNLGSSQPGNRYAQGNNSNANMPQGVDSDSASIAAPMVTLPNNMTVDQRLARLEQQMQNILQMNVSQRINDLQQTLQQLQGQLQQQQHDIKLLNQQQRDFYQDIDQRISRLKNLVGSGSNSNSNSSTPSSSSSSSSSHGSQSLKLSEPNTQARMAADSQNLKESSSYQSAFQLVVAKKYSAASKALSNYIKIYPQGNFVADAHYWLGQMLLLQKHPKKAAQQFTMLIKQYPQSAKIPDSKLKLAGILVNQGQVNQARLQLQQLQKDYPNTTAAKLAGIRLQQLSLAGAQ